MYGLDFIKKLKPSIFKYTPEHLRTKDQKTHFGFMAQDIAKLLGDTEEATTYAILKKDENNFYVVDHGELIAPLVRAVQELSAKVDELSKKEDKL